MTQGASFDQDEEEQYGISMEMEELVRSMSRQLQSAAEADLDEATDLALAEYVDALKALEDAAEEARKEVFEAELDDRVNQGQSVGPLLKASGASRYVTNEEQLREAIEEAGGDPEDAMEFKPTNVDEVADELDLDADEFIGRREYTYFRR